MAINRLDNGTDYDFFNHERGNHVPRSSFDLSRIVSTTMDLGALVPIDTIPTLPGDDFDLSLDMLIDTLPLAVNPLTRYTVTAHAYAMDYGDCWKGWKTFITKGRSGAVDLTVPKVSLSDPIRVSDTSYGPQNKSSSDSVLRTYLSPHSLASYLGASPATYFWKKEPYQQSFPSSITEGFADSVVAMYPNAYDNPCAFPFVMYQQICKHNYFNQNLLQDNTNWFPISGDDEWSLLPYNCVTSNFIGIPESYYKDGVCTGVTLNSTSPQGNTWVANEVPTSSKGDYPCLLQLRYRQWRNDYFVSGLPWLQRGTAPELSTSISEQFRIANPTLSWIANPSGAIASSPIYTGGAVGTDVGVSAARVEGFLAVARGNLNVNIPNPPAATQARISTVSSGQSTAAAALSGSASANLGISLNQFRTLIALTVWQERNARTNGSYNRLIQINYSQNPKTEEHLPKYIGGTSMTLQFNNVVQTSESSSDSPLGSKAAFGQTSGSGYIGHYHSNDFGMIMIILSIVPDTMYINGVEHWLSCENKQEDFYNPIFNALAPQAIKNKEIFVSSDSSVNEDMFAYQERYTYLKQRQNRVSGLLSAAPESDRLFSAYAQARYFDSLPKFSNQFVTMSPANVRRDMFAYPLEPGFIVQAAIRAKATRPLPYLNTPATFGF